MFVIAKKPTYAWPVEVHVPDPAKPGKWKTTTFIGHFKKLSDSDFREALERLTDVTLEPAERAARENEFIGSVLVNWEGIADEDGAAIPCTEENLAALLDLTEVRSALFEAAFNSRRKAALKN